MLKGAPSSAEGGRDVAIVWVRGWSLFIGIFIGMFMDFYGFL